MKLFEVFAIFTLMVVGSNAMIPNGLQVGGIDAFGQIYNPGIFPYIVRLENEKFNAKTKAYEVITCGGSIIRTNIILTAAHCVEGANPENVKAIAGVVHTRYYQESKQSITARRIVCHEQFENVAQNDIALVFLVDKFQKSRYVDTIKLARPSEYQNWMSVTAAGFGRLLNQTRTEWLHQGNFMMMGKDLCHFATGFRLHHEGLFCALDEKVLQQTAKGDSGGPLVGNNVLVGVIVGYQGHPFNVYDASRPSVFANVSYYTKWISEKIGYDILFFEK